MKRKVVQKLAQTSKKNNLNNKGITLIALIITIIILLILAAVSIKIALSGGLIDKAKSAVGLYNQKEKEQNETLQKYATTIDRLASAELKQMKVLEEGSDGSKQYIVSGYGFNKAGMYEDDAYGIILTQTESGETVTQILDKKNNKQYINITSKDISPFGEGETYSYVEINKWYAGTAASDTPLEEYTGSSPVQVSNFPDSEIYSKSYLEKIIKSFRTEPDTNKLGKLSIITDEELAKCKNNNETYFIATRDCDFDKGTVGENALYIMVSKEENQLVVAMFDQKNKKVYVYSSERGFKNLNKFNIWTVGTMATESTFENFEEYTGPSPIQASDFSSGNIYCSSYLDKIIKSFE